MFRVELVETKSDLERWNDFLTKEKSEKIITIAHNPSLMKILSDTFGYKSEYYIIIENEKIVGVLPGLRIKKKFVSIPHFSYGDILFRDDNLDFQFVRNEFIGKNYEIRSFKSLSGYVNNSKIMCYLNLKDSEEEQWAYWKSKLRSQIRKGIKNGIEVKIGGVEYLIDFYKIYSKNMHDLGSPVLSFKFFKNILELYRFGDAKIFLAQKDGIDMGASLVLTYMNFSEVCWASTLKKYNNLNVNMVLYWEMIKYAVVHQYKYFSFGRSTVNSNTHRFKKQWSPNEKKLFFNFSSKSKINVKRMKSLAKIWSKLPLFITNWAGPYFAKRLY